MPNWIWIAPKAFDNQVVYFRKDFDAKAGQKTTVAATCDNEMVIYVNGKKVAASVNWETPRLVDITSHLVNGKNLLAVQSRNQGEGSAGFIGKIVVTDGGAKREIVTDTSWKVSGAEVTNWQKPVRLNGPAWASAQVVAAAGAGAWAGTIKADTLDRAVALKEPEATPVAAIKVKEGFKVELLYSVPMAEQGSWVAMCFDDKGRIIASDQYGKLYRITPSAIGAPATTTKVEPIPVDIGEAQGLTYAFGALYVVTNSDKFARGLYRVTDRDRDDTFDKVEFLRAFDNQGGEHGPHAVMPGPDGKSLYVIVGNQTPITDMSDSLVPRHWGEDNLLPAMTGHGFMAGVKAPGGWVAKTDPDGKNWELVTSGFRNQYDAAFNKDGSLFTFDADMEWDFSLPWYRPTRVCEVIPGGEYGWRAISKKWPVRWEDGLPPVVDIGPGSPTGVSFGYGAKFPQKYQDAFYISDWSYGKMYAVHLKPDGAGYAADFEEFISASPLPVTDLAINPKDGAMYFMIGGRRVQGGLYRVTAIAGKTPGPIAAKPPLLDLRRKLEAFHGKKDPKAVDFAWPYLGHEDRLIRFAARIAIEHQPLSTWKDKALEEKNPRASLLALMALVRSAEGNKSLLQPVLVALDKIDFSKLSDDEKVTYVRDYQLAFSRLGGPEGATREAVATKLSALFPTKEPMLDVDLCEVLAYLGDTAFLPKAVAILETAPTQEEQISYAKNLRFVKNGWTPELRERFFKWIVLRAPTYKGGAGFGAFMNEIKRDALSTLNAAEKSALQPVLDMKPDLKTPQFNYTARDLVKNWTVADVDPVLAVGLEGGRNYENGRNLFGGTACFACHRFGSEGGAIGPDLSSVAGKYSPRDLLTHIIEPSKEISDQYGQVEVTMIDGSKKYGRVMNLSGDDLMFNVNMMDPNAIEQIDRKKIKSMEQSKTSMMPPGLLNTCTDKDILDLLAYLLSKGNKNDPLFK
ncbi:c-type cytochrome [Luteolibacter sp. Populi]|uniref:c-type cytochrome n=1 Tax=Luteolibacter sp. Populi TaxID=3230487 RepID=UPI003465AF63